MNQRTPSASTEEFFNTIGAKRSFMRKQDDGAPATARHGDGRVQAAVAGPHSSRKLYGDKKALLRLDSGQIRKELANQAKAPNNSIDIVQDKTKDVDID
jgi:hypothetical protein